ncbi:MAG: hypothetical protein SP1CHLAM54_03140 [Chlamydiia bacterium]|nr:hypothetical protein [Chlamydiia bacterium]MCH9615230.1 hypothetical protein [Chlamydiia bacterium]MCH9628448.1 hypothetical protein [Chlamydiia bacterium]
MEKKQTAIEELVKPVRDSMKELDQGMRKLEKERTEESTSLKEQLKHLIASERELKHETASLVKALKAPMVRGQWGELQLKRVIELAGMVEHCDFFPQVSGDGVRPDVVIQLPDEKRIVIDAKTPCEAYFEAMESTDDRLKEEKLHLHAKHLRNHINALGRKSYYEHFSPSPEFVVLFIPSDAFYQAALQFDPSLIEEGVKQGVVIATPTTLIGLLRAVSYGWKQEKLSLHAREISNLGAELHKRLADMLGHFGKLSRALSSAVEAYNKAMGSLETRVLVTARKFKSMGVAKLDKELDHIEPVEKAPRELAQKEQS